MMKKFFLKRLRTYFFYMSIPTIFILAATLVIFLYNNEKDLREEGEQTSLAVETNFDIVVSNVLYQNDLLTNTTKMSLALKNILKDRETSYGDAIYISSLSSILNSIIYSHSYIDSIYLYLDNCELFFSSGTAVQNINYVSNTSWLEVYQSMDKEQDIFIARRSSGSDSKNTLDTLSVFHRLLLQKGCIIVNININKFKKILGTMFSNEYETIYFLNSEGEVLVSKNNNSKIDGLPKEYFSSLVKKNNGDSDKAFDKINSKWVTVGDRKYLLSTRKYSNMDVYIVSSISADARISMLMVALRTFIIIFATNFIVVMTLAYITTKRTFDQISFMIQVFDDAEKGIIKQPKTKLQDEYDVIMNNIIYFFLNTTYLNTQLKEKQYRQKVAELSALQLQINPHFLFNTLQTLDLEVRKNTGETEHISTIIRGISDILKYALNDSQKDVLLKEEIEYLKKYIMIQKYRFGDNFIIYYEVEEDILNAVTFRLMLQPLLENSLIHGIRNLERKAYIKVKLYRRNEELICSVIDNGVGISKEKIQKLYVRINNEKSHSIGLTNLNRRLVLRYGEESALHIQSKRNYGTCISFRMPYEEDSLHH